MSGLVLIRRRSHVRPRILAPKQQLGTYLPTYLPTQCLIAGCESRPRSLSEVTDVATYDHTAVRYLTSIQQQVACGMIGRYHSNQLPDCQMSPYRCCLHHTDLVITELGPVIAKQRHRDDLGHRHISTSSQMDRDTLISSTRQLSWLHVQCWAPIRLTGVDHTKSSRSGSWV